MRPRRVIEEEDLVKYEANVARIKGTVGGGLNKAARVIASPLSGALLPTPSPYRSKLEALYAAHLDMLVSAGEIRRWEYEPMSLKLSLGKRYRPDFMVVPPLGAEAKPEMHEVKGKWTKNRRDSMTHLKWAAQRYGDVFTFRLIEWTGSGFSGSYVVT
jgi:hypothetical protein